MNGMLNFSYFQFVKIKCRSFPTQVMNPVLQTMAEWQNTVTECPPAHCVRTWSQAGWKQGLWGGRICKGLVSLTAQGRREMLHMEAREQDWPGFPPFSKARFSWALESYQSRRWSRNCLSSQTTLVTSSMTSKRSWTAMCLSHPVFQAGSPREGTKGSAAVGKQASSPYPRTPKTPAKHWAPRGWSWKQSQKGAKEARVWVRVWGWGAPITHLSLWPWSPPMPRWASWRRCCLNSVR